MKKKTATYTLTQSAQKLGRSISTVGRWIELLKIEWSLGPKSTMVLDQAAFDALRAHSKIARKRVSIVEKAKKEGRERIPASSNKSKLSAAS